VLNRKLHGLFPWCELLGFDLDFACLLAVVAMIQNMTIVNIDGKVFHALFPPSAGAKRTLNSVLPNAQFVRCADKGIFDFHLFLQELHQRYAQRGTLSRPTFE
jgi:hypothetical protein